MEYREYKYMFFIRYDYVFKISAGGKTGYNSAIALENFLYSVRRLDLLAPPRFWNKWFRSRRPTDSFFIKDMDYDKVFDWLQENVSYSNYQIYTKYGEDISLGFRDPEHATLFKLTFGEQDI